jgi:hypothetical protein
MANGMRAAGLVRCACCDRGHRQEMRVQARVARAITYGERLRAAGFLPRPRPCEAEWVSTPGLLNRIFSKIRN